MNNLPADSDTFPKEIRKSSKKKKKKNAIPESKPCNSREDLERDKITKEKVFGTWEKIQTQKIRVSLRERVQCAVVKKQCWVNNGWTRGGPGRVVDVVVGFDPRVLPESDSHIRILHTAVFPRRNWIPFRRWKMGIPFPPFGSMKISYKL